MNLLRHHVREWRLYATRAETAGLGYTRSRTCLFAVVDCGIAVIAAAAYLLLVVLCLKNSEQAYDDGRILLVFLLAIGLGWPLGLYLAKVMDGAPMRRDLRELVRASSGGIDQGKPRWVAWGCASCGRCLQRAISDSADRSVGRGASGSSTRLRVA